MNMESRSYLVTVIVLFSIMVALLLSGCTDPAADGLHGSESHSNTYHPTGWKDNPQHGSDFSTDPQNCKACHGEDLGGGTSGVSCADCHHNDDYPYHYHDGIAGGATHITLEGCDGCHGNDFTGGHSGQSCSTAACHTDRVTCSNPGCHQTLQSHPVHTVANNKGPSAMACDGTCHHANPLNYKQFQDGKDLSSTTVCDTCHSPGGTYDGVAMAKAKWENGAYEADGTTLKSGNEQWCATCHDEDPANSKADDSGENAPNIVGDEDAVTEYGTGYGFYKTGHGLPKVANYPASGVAGAGAKCSDCHDPAKSHIDHEHRSYQASLDNYQAGYRLVDVDGGPPMDIPRNCTGWDNCNWYSLEQYQDFALCWKCHDRTKVLGGPQYKEPSLEYYSRYAGNEYYQPQFTTNFRQCSTCNPSNSGTSTAVTANTLTDATRATDWAGSYVLVPGANHPELVYVITNLDNTTHTITVGSNIDMLADNPDLGPGSQFYTRAGDVNSHNIHLAGRGWCGASNDWDSDWDGGTDSPMSCPACHNVHGSPTPRMTRHGELIGHVDAINFRYYDGGGCTWTLADESMTLAESGGGHTDFIAAGPGIPAKNGICNMCHNDNTCYARNPVFDPVIVAAVANDSSGQGCGIQDGDEVVITFDKEIANPGAIDEVGDLYSILPIPVRTGDYWGAGTTVSWSNAGGHTNDTLTISLSANAAFGLGDVIVADGGSLQDSNGNPVANQKTISGTFGCP
jgi:hypothetical protein